MGPPADVEVTYSLTEADVRAMSDFVLWRRLKGLLIAIGVMYIFCAVVYPLLLYACSFWAPMAHRGITGVELVVYLASGAAGLIAWPLMRWVVHAITIRDLREAGLLSGPCRLQLSSDGLHSSQEGVGGTHRLWKATREIVTTERYVYIFLSWQQTYLIPRSAFTSPDHELLFLERARTWQDEAKRER